MHCVLYRRRRLAELTCYSPVVATSYLVGSFLQAFPADDSVPGLFCFYKFFVFVLYCLSFLSQFRLSYYLSFSIIFYTTMQQCQIDTVNAMLSQSIIITRSLSKTINASTHAHMLLIYYLMST